MYVDNCVASVDSSEELKSFHRDSTELLTLGKFDLIGWRHSDIEPNFDFRDNRQESGPQEIQIMWSMKEDTFSISYREIDSERKFEAWKKQLMEIQNIKIPRRLSNLDFKDANLSLRFFRVATKSSYARHDFHLPFILSSNHPVIKACINYKYAQLDHDGDQMLMYRLRKNYWILKGIRTIKEVIKICIICKRSNVKPISVSERLLLKDRVRDSAIFEIKGKDLARPQNLKNREKNWILILICSVYRAIYLELLTSIWTESGTNFEGDYRIYQKVNLEKLKNLEKLNPISWKFIPPQALCVSNGGARLEPRAETSSHQQAETSAMQPCSSVSNGGGGLKLRAETSGHQQAETSSMQPCSSVSDGGWSRELRPLNFQMT
ncbi:integrase catalytic domain-containing protein [Trichonephila clavata]|uniref:Integrase catalytic domain-containing protein n=1 Tax=Trichonephila clavata TaxID=2740835 RepID=A0A8X6FQV5_TRICU|nr:integrase catalytic domain-containing protein [Trichonephila clavata]